MREYNLRPPMNPTASEGELANSIRALAMDAVEAAKSGHPACPWEWRRFAVALWKRHRATTRPTRLARSHRFVLSNGHGSMCSTACCTSRATRCR